MKLKENVKLQIVFFLVVMVLLFGVYFPLSSTIKKISIRENALSRGVSVDNATMAGITEFEDEEKELSISGWVVRLNSELENICVVLVPEAPEDAESIVLNAKTVENSELQEYTEYLQVEESCGSGFMATVKPEKLQKDICYRVQVYTSYKQEENDGAVKIATSQYLYQGDLYDYNPLEFTAPEFADEQMQQVVENGALMGYTLEHGAWVYLYEGSLYWVLDKRVERNNNNDLHIFLHLNTVSKELLPESRRNYSFDNKDFAFRNKEMQVEESDNYRVAEFPLVTEYPITYILTGEYDTELKKNIWNTRFGLPLGSKE